MSEPWMPSDEEVAILIRAAVEVAVVETTRRLRKEHIDDLAHWGTHLRTEHSHALKCSLCQRLAVLRAELAALGPA